MPAAAARRLRIVAYFGYPRGLDVLLQAMREQDERLRDAAIYGLPFIDDPRAVDALLEAARHELRAHARGGHARAGPDGARRRASLRACCGGLNDHDPWVRYYACQSLGKLNDRGRRGRHRRAGQ